MQHSPIPTVSTIAFLLVAPAIVSATSITIDTVSVGNAGNVNDTTGYGAVPYDYYIGTTEVTIEQYTAFLNAVAATDTYNLYNPLMGTDLNIAGIAQGGTSGSFTYSVIGSGQRPIAYVSWGDAALSWFTGNWNCGRLALASW